MALGDALGWLLLVLDSTLPAFYWIAQRTAVNLVNSIKDDHTCYFDSCIGRSIALAEKIEGAFDHTILYDSRYMVASSVTYVGANLKSA